MPIRLYHIFTVPDFKMHYKVQNHMFLAPQFIKHSELMPIARNSEGDKILDNGACEGNMLDCDTFMDMAKNLKPNKIVLPDILGNALDTLILVNKALNHSDVDRFQKIAVVHGKTFEEAAKVFQIYESDPRIDIIGIPKYFQKMHPRGRQSFIETWAKGAKPIHLLGIQYATSEVFGILDERVQSCDTSIFTFIRKWGTTIKPDGFNIDLEHDSVYSGDEALNTYL